MCNVQKLISGRRVFAHLIFGLTMRVCKGECSNVQMFHDFRESGQKISRAPVGWGREVNLDFFLFFFVHLNIWTFALGTRMVKPKMNVQNRFRCLDIVYKQGVVRVLLFWSISEQPKNGLAMRVWESYPQKKCRGSCSCRSRPLVTGFNLSGGGRREGDAWERRGELNWV